MTKAGKRLIEAAKGAGNPAAVYIPELSICRLCMKAGNGCPVLTFGTEATATGTIVLKCHDFIEDGEKVSTSFSATLTG